MQTVRDIEGLREKIVENIKIDSKGCWIWQLSTVKGGYGQTSWEGSRPNTHRAAYMAWKGGIRKGLYVLHSCDTPACCNPDHLSLGTQRDNIRDMHRKGRGLIQEKHPMARLSAEEVSAIRDLYSARTHTQLEISKMYKVSRPMISLIVNNKRWEGELYAN